MISNHTKINTLAQAQIENIKEQCAKIKPCVAINCITYNHEPYIREALDGFVMQKTNFPFVAVVHDDASTDGTSEILREYAEKYPDMIIPIYEKENQYSKGNGILRNIVWSACLATGAKYIAFCEGDDYWTDPLKLQKQVDYLEEHPDCSLVCSNYNSFIQKEKKILLYNGKSGRISYKDLILHNYVATLTSVFPTSLIKDYLEFSKDAPNWSFGDYPMWLFAITKGYVMKLSDTTAVYRVLEESASHIKKDTDRLRWAYSEFSVIEYFASRHKFPIKTIKRALFYRSHFYTPLALSTKDQYLINKISSFYRDNYFFIAWSFFRLGSKYPFFAMLTKKINSHLCLLAPFYYLKGKLDRNVF